MLDSGPEFGHFHNSRVHGDQQMMDKETALRLVEGRPWHHDFEIIPGVRTRGSYDPRNLWEELRLPSDLSGMSLADVGASNGFFSFEARRRGARVVAFDRRHADNSGFALAQLINGMHDIEFHQANVLDLGPGKHGQFDFVLALGLLYHVSDPYLALSNCAALSRRHLYIESFCIDALLPRSLRREPVMKFISDPERFPDRWQVNRDRSNFWGFTSVCLQHMLEDVGFAVTHVRVHGSRVFIAAERAAVERARTRLPIAYDTIPGILAGTDRNDPGAWTIF